jgi:hypothetical protein
MGPYLKRTPSCLAVALQTYLTFPSSNFQQLPNPNSPSKFKGKGSSAARENDGAHPWDFGYIKERAKNQPYWLNSTIPKELGDERFKTGTHVHLPGGEIPSAEQRRTRLQISGNMGTVAKGSMATLSHGGDAISDAARVGLLRGLDKATIGTCLKCNRVLLPIWRQLRSEFKRHQESNARGFITAPTLVQVLESFGVKLAGSEVKGLVAAFGPKGRGAAVGNAVKFDDFMRICLVASPDVCRAAGC